MMGSRNGGRAAGRYGAMPARMLRGVVGFVLAVTLAGCLESKDGGEGFDVRYQSLETRWERLTEMDGSISVDGPIEVMERLAYRHPSLYREAYLLSDGSMVYEENPEADSESLNHYISVLTENYLSDDSGEPQVELAPRNFRVVSEQGRRLYYSVVQGRQGLCLLFVLANQEAKGSKPGYLHGIRCKPGATTAAKSLSAETVDRMSNVLLDGGKAARNKFFAKALEKLRGREEEALVPGSRTAAVDPNRLDWFGGRYDPSRVVEAGGVELGRNFALVIGISDYRDPIPDLDTPANDGESVARVLQYRYGANVLLLRDATKQQIVDSLAGLTGIMTPADSLIVYYAGHGVVDDVTGKGYWLAGDAETDSPDNWISNQALATALQEVKARQVLVVADACYSGSFNREGRFETAQVRDLRTLAGMRARTFLSSGDLEPVIDGGGSGHSVFAEEFIAALLQTDGWTIGSDFYQQVAKGVEGRTFQRPQYGFLSGVEHTQGADFVLAEYVQ